MVDFKSLCFIGVVHMAFLHPENDVNSLENKVSISDGQAVVAALSLLISMSVIFTIFGSVVFPLVLVAGGTELFFLMGWCKRNFWYMWRDLSRQSLYIVVDQCLDSTLRICAHYGQTLHLPLL